MNPLRIIHGWALLTSAADYEFWHSQFGAENGQPPVEFPCFALATFCFGGGQEYEYMYSEQLGDMQDALALVASSVTI
ncbi:hypothetical protein CCAX7_54090 [Capsulimonas corticalis]|uniref:Uncharacterized protein n=1 Tax=Capsulimonas corticalis TaxID=2219043 RepID=A0A402CNN5_9BACT|nr:hypothetical protein [Capsulimonas corticalis]BDI33358.1 hypothetical protein CCAX7_54090 [Capsulimonas corticalis]